jgi:hypothetical protein
MVNDWLWTKILGEARAGVLEPSWRDTLSVEPLYAAGVSRTMFEADQQVRMDVDKLVIHEAATMPFAAWEPYVAGGDWRRALSAWFTAAQDLLRYKFRSKRWLSDIIPDQDHTASARLDAVLEAHERDALEVSYRAGLAAGGDEEDWIGWYRTRVIETWDADDDAKYRLYYSVEHALGRCDAELSGQNPAPAALVDIPFLGSTFQSLPDYRRTGQPPAAHQPASDAEG